MCRRLPKPKGQTVGSFRKGLTMLPEAISARYYLLCYTNVLVDSPVFAWVLFLVNCVPVDRLGSKVKLSWKLLSVSKLDSGEYSLTYETPEGVVSLQSKTVVMTIPSHVASTLLRPLAVSFSQKGIISIFYFDDDCFISWIFWILVICRIEIMFVWNLIPYCRSLVCCACVSFASLHVWVFILCAVCSVHMHCIFFVPMVAHVTIYHPLNFIENNWFPTHMWIILTYSAEELAFQKTYKYG